MSGVTLFGLSVGMIIMGIVSTMLVPGWFTLSGCHSFSVHSADARDSGGPGSCPHAVGGRRRSEAANRLQDPPPAADAIVLEGASAYLDRPLNDVQPAREQRYGVDGNPGAHAFPSLKVHLVVYRCTEAAGASRT